MFFCYKNMVAVEGRKLKEEEQQQHVVLWIQRSFAGPFILPPKITRVSSRFCCWKLKKIF